MLSFSVIFVFLKSTHGQLPPRTDITLDQKSKIIELIENQIGFQDSRCLYIFNDATPGTADVYTRAKLIDSIKELTNQQIESIITEYIAYLTKTSKYDSDSLLKCTGDELYRSIFNKTSCSYTIDEATHEAKINRASMICINESVSAHSKKVFLCEFTILKSRFSAYAMQIENTGKFDSEKIEVIRRTTRSALASSDEDVTLQIVIDKVSKNTEFAAIFTDVLTTDQRKSMILKCEINKIFESEHPRKRSKSLSIQNIILISVGSFCFAVLAVTLGFFMPKLLKRVKAQSSTN